MNVAETLNIHWDPQRLAHILLIDTKHQNRNGMVHGGVLCSLADWSMASKALDMLSNQQTVATLSLNTCFVNPGKKGDNLYAVAKIISQTRKVIHAECSITNDQEQLICKAWATFIIKNKLLM